MKPGELLRLVGDSVRTWLECLFQPLTTVSRMLRAFQQDRSLAPVAKIWTATLTLSLILSYPILNLFGIQWNNFGYHAPEQAVVILTILMAGLLSHIFLRCSKMRSNVYETILLYTVVVIYTPITTVMAIPESYKMYALLQMLKHLNVDLSEVFRYIKSHGLMGNIASLDLYQLFVYGTAFIGFLTLAAYAECIVQWYGNPRFRTYLAVGIAAYVMFWAYREFAVPFRLLLIYSFIQ